MTLKETVEDLENTVKRLKESIGEAEKIGRMEKNLEKLEDNLKDLQEKVSGLEAGKEEKIKEIQIILTEIVNLVGDQLGVPMDAVLIKKRIDSL